MDASHALVSLAAANPENVTEFNLRQAQRFGRSANLAAQLT
jgi:hypothetical protein